jgi:hypothetical protein
MSVKVMMGEAQLDMMGGSLSWEENHESNFIGEREFKEVISVAADCISKSSESATPVETSSTNPYASL